MVSNSLDCRGYIFGACLFSLGNNFLSNTRWYFKSLFLDVGQGDAIFIEAPNGNQVLVEWFRSTSLTGFGASDAFLTGQLIWLLRPMPMPIILGALDQFFNVLKSWGLWTMV